MRGPYLIGTDIGTATEMEELVAARVVSAWSSQVGADPFSCLAQFVNLGRMGLGTVQVCSPALKLFVISRDL